MKRLLEGISIYVSSSPFSPILGLVRSILALSLLLTLAFNSTSTLFKPVSGRKEIIDCSGDNHLTILCILNPNNYDSLIIMKFVTIILLIIIMVGYFPQVLGIIHFYIAYSVQHTMSIVGGGEQMKKILMNVLITVILISFVLPNNKVKAFSVNNYSGEELFEGIFFGYGEVGKQLPELWEDTEFKNLKLTKGFEDRVHSLENQLKIKDKNYFVKFKNDIISGNHIKIENQFNKINKDITIIGEKYLDDNSQEYGNRALKPGFVLVLAYAYVGATHIAGAAILTAVAVGHYAVVGTKVAVKGKSRSAVVENGWSQEKYINLIADRFKHE
ncbi:hypothetical protein ACWEWU_14330 [Staphylococcus xylosus]